MSEQNSVLVDREGVVDRGLQIARLPRGKSLAAAGARQRRKIRIRKFDGFAESRQADALRL